jgi:hypothetical protein
VVLVASSADATEQYVEGDEGQEALMAEARDDALDDGMVSMDTEARKRKAANRRALIQRARCVAAFPSLYPPSLPLALLR